MAPCTCREHVDDLLDIVLPDVFGDGEPTTIGDLIICGALSAERPTKAPVGEWGLWVGDEARVYYSDDAETSFDDALAAADGVDGVDWEDRETFTVVAPSLCPQGVLAVAARALLDPETGWADWN